MSDENYIKMDGEVDSFKGGATRYSKKGKGRFDLIPGEVVYNLLMFADVLVYSEFDTYYFDKWDVVKHAYFEDDARYIFALYEFIGYYYADGDVDEHGVRKVNKSQWLAGLAKALKDLAVHYEFGAEKYGVDNWKKGIPIIGGDRGGNFTDSGLRHLSQFLMGETDEKHGVAFMWNFCGALYLQSFDKNVNFYDIAISLKNGIILKNEEAYEFDNDD